MCTEIPDGIDFILSIQIQVKKQLRRKEEDENYACNKGKHRHAKMRSFVRLVVPVIAHFLTAIFKCCRISWF